MPTLTYTYTAVISDGEHELRYQDLTLNHSFNSDNYQLNVQGHEIRFPLRHFQLVLIGFAPH